MTDSSSAALDHDLVLWRAEEPAWTPERTDAWFRRLVLAFAASLLGICAGIGWILLSRAWPAVVQFGWRFVITTTWDPVADVYGALPFIYGTLTTSAVALAVALPLSLGAAIFLAELAPPWVRGPVSAVIELLAAIPSIVYGLWGLFVLIPLVRPVQNWLSHHASFIPFFNGAPYGLGIFSAGLVLAIMITPIITSICREVIVAVPRPIRDAAYALGATQWETIRGPVLHYGRGGIVGAVLLALGRALGETMAVTMVIGNTPAMPLCLFSPGYSMASLLANEFAEATGQLHVASLMTIGLLLFGLTILVNIAARLLLWRVTQGSGEAAKE